MSKRKDGIGLFQFSGPYRKDDWKQRQIDAARRGEWYGSGPPTIKHKAIKGGTIRPDESRATEGTGAIAVSKDEERVTSVTIEVVYEDDRDPSEEAANLITHLFNTYNDNNSLNHIRFVGSSEWVVDED